MAGRILIVEDEEAVRFFAAEGLARAGWQVDEAASGEAALAMLAETPYDVVLLDLRLAEMDGLTVMRQTRTRWPATMIIIMTAYASLDSAIEAVRQGAFDYLQKPCSSDEIVACANLALAEKEALDRQRRLADRAETKPPVQPDTASAAATATVHSGALAIDLGAHRVALAGQPIAITPTEYELLAILARSPGQPVSLERLIREGLSYDPTDPQAQETLRVHISRLRRKLGPGYILTVRGGSYALANIRPAT